MRFLDGAPFGRQCYWILSVYDCEHELIHQVIMYISLFAHLIPIALGSYLIWFRWKHLWPTLMAESARGRIIRLPVDALLLSFVFVCITRWLHTFLLVLNVIPTFAGRELFNDFSYWGGLWAVTVFLAGIIESIPPAFVRGTGRSNSLAATGKLGDGLTVWVPPRWLFALIFVILMLWGACLTAPFTYMAGHGADIGDWELFEWGIHLGYLMWSINLLILVFIAGYYCISLLIIIRHNLMIQKASRDLTSDEIEAVSNLQRIFLYNGMVCIGGMSICLVWTFFQKPVLNRLWLSLLMELPVQIFWWPVIALLIMLRIYRNSIQKAESITRRSNGQSGNSATMSSSATAKKSQRMGKFSSYCDDEVECDYNTRGRNQLSALSAVKTAGDEEIELDNYPTGGYHTQLAQRVQNSMRQNAVVAPLQSNTTPRVETSLQSRSAGAVSFDRQGITTQPSNSVSANSNLDANHSTLPSQHLLMRGLAGAVERLTEQTGAGNNGRPSIDPRHRDGLHTQTTGITSEPTIHHNRNPSQADSLPPTNLASSYYPSATALLSSEDDENSNVTY
jgi:hypothetical protein